MCVISLSITRKEWKYRVFKLMLPLEFRCFMLPKYPCLEFNILRIGCWCIDWCYRKIWSGRMISRACVRVCVCADVDGCFTTILRHYIRLCSLTLQIRELLLPPLVIGPVSIIGSNRSSAFMTNIYIYIYIYISYISTEEPT